MNYTENYRLPQWEGSDRIMMRDFNQMCASIDAGISAAAQIPFAVGSYVGTGLEQEIEVGFRPRLVIICCNQLGPNPPDVAGTIAVAGEAVTSRDRIVMTDKGFRLGAYNSAMMYPRVNERMDYNYIAFR